MIFHLHHFRREFRRVNGRAPTDEEVVQGQLVQEWRRNNPDASEYEATKAMERSGLIVELTVLVLVVQLCYLLWRWRRDLGQWECCEELGDDEE